MTYITKTDRLHPFDLANSPGTFKPVELARPPATLADLLALVATWTQWPVSRRRICTSHIRTAALIARTGTLRATGRLDRVRRAEIAAASIPSDPEWLNARLFLASASAFGLTKDSFDNVISGLRSAMREAGVIGPKPPLPPVGSAWRGMLDALEADEHCRLGLIQFASWCHARGIAPRPDASLDPTLSAFQHFLTTETLHPDIPGMVGTVAKAWRKAARLVADWPQRLLEPPRRRQTYTLPFEQFPQSFQDDVARFRERLTGDTRRGPFSGDGPPRSLRPSTIETRLYCLRQAASALAIIRSGPGTVTSLADLVEEGALRGILMFFWEKAISTRVEKGEFGCVEEAPSEAGVTSQTGGIAATLMMIARYHCRLPPDTITELRELAADLQPSRQASITPKNLERLRQFDDPMTRMDLLDLPDKLMQRADDLLREAERNSTKSMKAAYLARTAAALMILLHIPLRISNLARLRLGQHLKFDGSRTGRIFLLALQEHETKNTQYLEWSVSADTAAFLDRYLKRFRVLLARPGSTCLFPGRGGNNAISLDGLRYHIVRTVADEIGAVINPHLFRALAARFALEHSPGALEDVRALLGDKSLEVVLAHYAALQPAIAARRHDDVLRRTRAEAMRQAMPQPRKRRP